jgi:hypothetical protein
MGDGANVDIRCILGRKRSTLAESIEHELPELPRAGDERRRWRRWVRELGRAGGNTMRCGETPPYAGRRRPVDVDRLVVGVRLAEIFEEHGQRPSYSRNGVFDKTLDKVLQMLGYRMGADRLWLLRAIRSARTWRERLAEMAASAPPATIKAGYYRPTK